LETLEAHPFFMKTFSAKAQEQTNRQWYVIDAKGQILGDVAVAAANILRGKTKPTFTPHVDTGDFVVVLNAAEVRLSGKKEEQKIYTSKRGYIGNQKIENVSRVRERRPELLIERAVKGMVPHNRLGRAVMGKLKIYRGTEHPHTAQHPKPFSVA
jgi:large subunit ribosomal protein L13